MPTTTGMKGDGYYNAHSNEQRVALDAFLPWIEDALVDLPLPSAGSPLIGLLDLGSSEGSTAIHAMTRIVEALRRRSAAPIWIFFNDLPSNDFNSASPGIYDVLSDALLDAVEDGLLPRKIYQELIFPVYFRALAELTAPIESEYRLGDTAYKALRSEASADPVRYASFLLPAARNNAE